METNSEEIVKFVSSVRATIINNKDFDEIREMKKLDGLAKLSINQNNIWKAEIELIKMFSKPE